MNGSKHTNRWTIICCCLCCLLGAAAFVGIILVYVTKFFKIHSLQEFIAVSPLFFFIFMIVVLCWWLRDYDFSSALSENWASPNDPKVLPKSSSRLLAFFSGLTAIIIAITVTSAYLYKILVAKDTSDLQLGQFAKFIASLGIGIIPYITNKVVTGNKPK
ncbi:hypothetical protein [Desulfonauticus submarinus]